MVTVAHGFVVDKYDYHKFDAIVYAFTQEYGPIKFIARGVRKQTSKNQYGLQPLIESKLEIFLAGSPERLSLLKTAKIIENFSLIQNQPQMLMYCNLMLELLFYGGDLGAPNPEGYALLLFSFLAFQKQINLLTISTFFMFKSLNWLGGQWNLYGCGRCGYNKNIVYFSLLDQSFVCGNCLNYNEKMQRRSFLKIIYEWAQSDFNYEHLLNRYYWYEDLIMLHEILMIVLRDKLGFKSQSWSKLWMHSIFLTRLKTKY